MILFSCASFISFLYLVCPLLINSFRFSLYYCLQTKSIYFLVVHWYTVTQLSTSEDIASRQMQFILWWYTGTLSHNFVSQCLLCLLSPTKVNLIIGGTLVHCHTTQYFSKHCFQPKAVLSFVTVYQCTTMNKIDFGWRQ
jgi:hypothetical protein